MGTLRTRPSLPSISHTPVETTSHQWSLFRWSLCQLDSCCIWSVALGTRGLFTPQRTKLALSSSKCSLTRRSTQLGTYFPPHEPTPPPHHQRAGKCTQGSC